MKLIHRATWVLLLTFLVGCQSQSNDSLPPEIRGIENVTVYSSDEQPRHSVTLTAEQAFGDTEEIFFERISNFAVDESGRVYIPQDSILVFDSDGSYLRSIGNEGRGPGEFQTIGNVKVAGDKLFVFDIMLQRLSTFSIDNGEHINTIDASHPDDKWGIGELYSKGNGDMLLAYEDRPLPDVERDKYLYPVREEEIAYSNEIITKPIETIFNIEDNGRTMQGTFPFDRTTLTAVSDQGTIYSAWTENFLVREYSADGEYNQAFYYPHDSKALDPHSYFESGMIRKAKWKKLDLPDNWPVINNMLIDDDDRLWISTIIENDESYQWWVLETDGTLLAKFTWPRDKEIKKVTQGKLYALEEEADTGIDQIGRYRVQMD